MNIHAASQFEKEMPPYDETTGKYNNS